MQGLGNPLQYGKAFGESYGCGAKCRAQVTCAQVDDVRQLGQVHHLHGVTLTPRDNPDNRRRNIWSVVQTAVRGGVLCAEP